MSTDIKKSFADWENGVFGFGYGSGEVYMLTALRQFFSLCNRSDNGQYDYKILESEMGPTVAWLMICAMGHADIIEYGSSPRYAWLTEKGQALKSFVLTHSPDELAGFTCRAEEREVCYRDACNCGPAGYEKGRVCVNPFWQDDAARAYLATLPSTNDAEKPGTTPESAAPDTPRRPGQ